MNYIIFDLEATCWENKQEHRGENETIEIGAIMINEKKEIVSEFCSFVKPVRNPMLTDFCTELTSIRQDDVDSAKKFNEVIEEFKSWITSSGQDDYILCSWGFYDRRQLERDLDIYDVDKEWIKKHISLKHQYPAIKGFKKRIGIKNALEKEGITFTGRHHRGIDDARNISKIFIRYFYKWDFTVF